MGDFYRKFEKDKYAKRCEEKKENGNRKRHSGTSCGFKTAKDHLKSKRMKSNSPEHVGNRKASELIATSSDYNNEYNSQTINDGTKNVVNYSNYDGNAKGGSETSGVVTTDDLFHQLNDDPDSECKKVEEENQEEHLNHLKISDNVRKVIEERYQIFENMIKQTEMVCKEMSNRDNSVKEPKHVKAKSKMKNLFGDESDEDGSGNGSSRDAQAKHRHARKRGRDTADDRRYDEKRHKRADVHDGEKTVSKEKDVKRRASDEREGTNEKVKLTETNESCGASSASKEQFDVSDTLEGNKDQGHNQTKTQPHEKEKSRHSHAKPKMKKTEIGLLVVKLLTPAYANKRFDSRETFKTLARTISHSLLDKGTCDRLLHLSMPNRYVC